MDFQQFWVKCRRVYCDAFEISCMQLYQRVDVYKLQQTKYKRLIFHGICAGTLAHFLSLSASQQLFSVVGISSRGFTGTFVGLVYTSLHASFCGAFVHYFLRRESPIEFIDDHENGFTDSIFIKISSVINELKLPDYSIYYDPVFEDTTKRLIFYGISGLCLFRLGGRRFSHLLPSDLIAPGSFANKGTPANLYVYASGSTKEYLNSQGWKYGCHHCGSRYTSSSGGSFIGDHIPPNKYSSDLSQQKFYPQCTKCSSLQSTAVLTDTKRLVTHPFRLTLSRLLVYIIPSMLAILEFF